LGFSTKIDGTSPVFCRLNSENLLLLPCLTKSSSISPAVVVTCRISTKPMASSFVASVGAGTIAVGVGAKALVF